MGNMKEIGLLDCEDRPSVEENFKRVYTGKIPPEQLPDGYPYDAGSFYYDNSVFKDGDEIISGAFFKVSDDTPSYDELMGATIILPDVEILVDENVLMYVEGEMCAAGEYCIVVYKDNVSVGGQFTLPSAGVYMIIPSTISVSVSKQGIVPIAGKFLPMLAVAIVYDGSSYTCNKTYKEVYNALNNNIPIYAIYTEYNSQGRKLQCLYEEVRHNYDEHIMFIGNMYSGNLHLYTNNEVHPEEMEN